MKNYSNILIAWLLSVACTRSEAQSTLGVGRDSTGKNADHLLWYSGKKKNDTTLVLPTGAVVHYSPAFNSVSVDPGGNEDAFKPLEDEIEKTEERKEVAKKVLLSGPDGAVKYPLYQALEKAYDQEAAEYRKLTTHSLPLSEVAATPTPNKQTDLVQLLNNLCSSEKSNYDYIIAWAKAHRKDRNFTVSDPPSMDYDHCWDCHPEKQKQYDKQINSYDSITFLEESKCLEGAYRILRSMAMLGMGEKGMEFNSEDGDRIIEALGSAKHPTACTWLLSAQSELTEAIYIIHDYVRDKAAYLFRTYKKDPHYLAAVIKIRLARERDFILATGNITNDDELMAEVGSAVYDFYYKYRTRMFEEHDYTQLPNLGFLYSLLRQCELLHIVDYAEEDRQFQYINDHDRFLFTIDIDCKMGGSGTYELAHLKGENYLIATPDPKSCGLQWSIIEATDKKRNLELNLVAADLIPQYATYTGTHSWQTLPPFLRIHTCDQGKDTIVFPAPHPKDFQETWRTKDGQPLYGIINSLLVTCFIDEAHMQEAAAELESHEAEIEQKMQQKGAEISAQAAKAKNLKGADQAAEISKLMQEGKDLMRLPNQVAPRMIGNFYFETTMHNDTVMVEETIDGKKLVPENEAIVYAYCRIKIQQQTRKAGH